MEANLKLKKKKRVAHSGSKLPHMSCEESNLEPDDFVYNIMKEMDENKSIVSYHQSQFQSQKRQDVSQKEDNFSYQKQPRKMFPKKIFPLMKKSQTSLNHLKKNRCIPKPRAHVGYVAKPQFKPILNVENNVTRFQNGSTRSITNPKQSISKSKCNISKPTIKVCKSSNFKNSKNSHPDFKACKSSNSNSYVNKEDVNHVKNKAPVEDQLSSSDDDDDAFEHFVQKANEKDSDLSDTDSDSRLIIHRKRSKTKSKQKKKMSKDSVPDEKVNTCVSKITSRPLPDSSESEGRETFGVLKNRSTSFKRRRYSEHELPMESQKNTKETIPDEITHNSNLSEEDPLDMGDINYDSDSESNLETPTSCVLPINRSLPFDHTEIKSCKNIRENKVTHSIVDIDIPIINLDCNSCYSEPIKSVPKCDKPCHVRLIRDPEIDKIAISLCSTTPIFPTSNTFYSSDDDCIVISENSDNEDLPEAPKSQSDSSSSTTWPCKNTEPVDCDIMCQVPKQVLVPQNRESSNLKLPLLNTPDRTNQLQIHNFGERQNLANLKLSNQIGFATLEKDSLNQHSLHTERECVIVREKSKLGASQKLLELSDSSLSNQVVNPGLFSQATNELSSLGHNEDNTMNSERESFNVKIVAVHSLSKLNESLIEPSASECNDIEIIELSDEESQVPDIQEKSNTVEEKISLTGSLKILNQNESAIENESNLALKGEPNQKILEILSKIDFECIKEAISKIKVENSNNVSCKNRENSTCSNLLSPGTSVPMPIRGKDIIGQEINSQVRNLNEFPDKLSESQKDELVNNIAPKYVSNNNEKVFHPSNQTLEKDINKSRFETGMSLVNNEKTNSLINVCATEIPSEALPKNLVKETIHSKQNFEYVSNQFPKTVQSCKDTFSNDLKEIEITTKGAAKNVQDSNTVFKATTFQVTITNNERFNVPELTGKFEISKVRNEKSIQNRHIIHPVKKETVIESTSNELDALAALYLSDFKPSNKKVIPLFDLFKKEYEKYKQILNTETNVSAGLKLLHDKQVNKLKHIHASMENLAKHDACFHKVYQEDCCNKIKASMKNEIKDEGVVKKESRQNSTELKCEEPLPEKDVQVATKLDSAGSSREKMLRLMMNLKCAQCGKPATGRCQGCAEVYYCSPDCGERSWRQGHYAVCKKT